MSSQRSAELELAPLEEQVPMDPASPAVSEDALLHVKASSDSSPPESAPQAAQVAASRL